jgi:hypothetical protein
MLRFSAVSPHSHALYLVLFLFSLAATYLGFLLCQITLLFVLIVDLANWQSMADGIHSFAT